MKKIQAGFTLIELVVVIVILGILAAVAIPKFIDLSDEAYTAALGGVQGGMASAMAINYAGCSAKNHAPGPKCVAIADCDEVDTIMVGGVLPDGYTVAAGPIGAGNGTVATCTVTSTAPTPDKTATFVGIRAGT